MIIPDCTYCGGKVRIDFEIVDGGGFIHERQIEAVEVCDGCGVGQTIMPHHVLPPRVAAEIRRDIRRAWARRRLEHQRCNDITCECFCHHRRAVAS